MIVLRNKSFSLLEKRQYYKNNWDRLKAGWIGTSKKSIDKYNKYVDTHNELERLKENNPKEFLRKYYSIDKVRKDIKILELLPKDKIKNLYQYLDCIESFAPEFGRLCKQNPEFDSSRLSKIIPTITPIDIITDTYEELEFFPLLDGSEPLCCDSNGKFHYKDKYLSNFKSGVIKMAEDCINDLKLSESWEVGDKLDRVQAEQLLVKAWINHVKTKM